MAERNKPKVIDRVVLSVISRAVYFYFCCICKVRISGIEHLHRAKESGFMIVANHGSHADGIVLWSLVLRNLNIKMRFLAKRKLWQHPLMGFLIRGARCIPVNEDGGLGVNEGRELLANRERYIGIFPAGTRQKNAPYKKGAEVLAKKLGIPIIPCRLQGFDKAWPKGNIIPRLFPLFTLCEVTFFAATEDLNLAMDQIVRRQNKALGGDPWPMRSEGNPDSSGGEPEPPYKNAGHVVPQELDWKAQGHGHA
ncbi:MAG: lysophospholipid acyltransferase family protein [Chitinivibrionales bacterium]|nr:lysophospholipid acyltransferase family protein [Chitinivibrionales bacterium]